MIDEIDANILAILQCDARTSNAEIARRVGMAPSGVLERIRKLEERGVIRGYGLRVNPAALGFGLLAYVQVRTEGGGWQSQLGRALSELPEVQEVHHIAGEDCFLVKVRARDTDSLGALLRDRLGNIASVRSTRTTIVLETVAERTTLPIASQRKEDKEP